MLKIRLKRTGKRGEAHYRVVVIESTKPRDSRPVAEIGYYNPRTKPSTLNLDVDAAKSWLEKGAQPTETMAQMFVKQGLLKELKRGSRLAKQRPSKKEAKAAANA